MEFGRSTLDLRKPSAGHLLALQRAFETILRERLRTAPISEPCQKIEELIQNTRPGTPPPPHVRLTCVFVRRLSD